MHTPFIYTVPCFTVKPLVCVSAAGCWVRDGINLRLEIGICSVGEPDTALASLAAPVAAAAAAKTKPDSAAAGQQQQQQAIACMHQRDQQWGSGNHEDTDGAPPARSQQHKRHSKAQPQQQQKRQKISEAGHGQQVTNRRGQQQQQQQQPTAAFPDKRLEIVAASPVPAGAEVHNTYGGRRGLGLQCRMIRLLAKLRGVSVPEQRLVLSAAVTVLCTNVYSSVSPVFDAAKCAARSVAAAPSSICAG